jgi:hypothetical protein
METILREAAVSPSQPQIPRSERQPLVEQALAELEVATADRNAIVHQGT